MYAFFVAVQLDERWTVRRGGASLVGRAGPSKSSTLRAIALPESSSLILVASWAWMASLSNGKCVQAKTIVSMCSAPGLLSKSRSVACMAICGDWPF